ncbi:arylsulfotransferase family protein [uncultured Desulfobacter sp.]|uniref:arylsulfotransferase family protein n=1 Tax=uncultured Desulfobacter sp. TaxID=240139 RepID=UPI002AAB51C1|nr:arylsulfotransferase family protein [uncultured Desulfobacter sp.]
MSEKKNRGSFLRLLALCWLVFLTSFCAGIYIYVAKIWPYPIIITIEKFLAGHPEENTSLLEKLENDLDIIPARHLVNSEKEYDIPEDYQELKGLGLKSHRENPRIFFAGNAPKGYRVIQGVFDFKDSFHGVILFGQDQRVMNIWHIRQDDVEWEHRPDNNCFPHGFVIGRDGSIVTAFDAGTSLTKYDWCGNILWRVKGGFHHSIAFDGDSAIWTWGKVGAEIGYGDNLIKVDYRTGKILKEFHMNEVVKANLDIDIFSILQEDSAEGSKWIGDESGGRWHVNDIDPLPANLEQYYPRFKAGDLLLSLRSPDLICVIDPDTYRVKWWRQGLTRRQHDPDWNSKGTITIFNNNMHRGYSSIVELNPRSYEYHHVLKGKDYQFYTWMRGKHQLLPNGGYLITSTQQGRVFETNEKGDIVFEFINLFGKDKGFLAVSEAVFLPLDYFKELPECAKQ